MLAGVGPVRLVLFVVAADEGWKPQSEEHLQILDVLGDRRGRRRADETDLVDDETLTLAEAEVRERTRRHRARRRADRAGERATGAGWTTLRAALDAMVAGARDAGGRAREPSVRRPGLHDRRAPAPS